MEFEKKLSYFIKSEVDISTKECFEMSEYLSKSLIFSMKQSSLEQNTALLNIYRPGGILIYELNKKLQLYGLNYNPTIFVDNVLSDNSHYGFAVGKDALTRFSNEKELIKFANKSFLLAKEYGVDVLLSPRVEYEYKENIDIFEKKTRRGKIVLDIGSSFGVAQTLKHFPYSHKFDLHQKTLDVHVEKSFRDKALSVFKKLSSYTPYIMTTHILDKSYDKQIVTFSKKWISLLKKELGEKKIIISDGIGMLAGYHQELKKELRYMGDDRVSSYPVLKNKFSIYALKAILAGHDMIILDVNLFDATAVYDELLSLACQNSNLSLELRRVLHDSFKKLNSI